MRSMKKSAVVLLLLGLATGGCNRGPAEEALGVAEETLADAQVDLERFAPEQLAPLQHGVQLHDQRGQRRETAAETDGEQQTVLVGDHAGFVEPRRRGNQVGDNPHGQAAEKVRGERAPRKRRIALHEDIQREPRHRAERAAGRDGQSGS